MACCGCAQEPEAGAPLAVGSATSSADAANSASNTPGTPNTAVSQPPDKHMFGILPNYRTADPTQAFRALSPLEKFTIAEHDSFDPPGYFIAGWYTMIYQLQNPNPEFGQGMKGYAHRYATTYADQMAGNIMTEGAMPSLLHEDPRYFRRGYGSVPVRVAWALSRILVTRTDRDKYRFNYSEFLGNAVSASIANAYYPRNRTPGDNVQRLEVQLMSDSISNCLKEFWPDIKKALHPGSMRRHTAHDR